MKKTISILLTVALLLCIAIPVSAASHPFTDVPEGSWYESYVQYVYDNGLMNGTSETTFSPTSNMTRGMVVTVLYRAAGSPAVSESHPFTDVPAGKWYETPVVWAYQNEIVNGTSATTFAPNANVSREQLVTIFYRYANSCGYDTSDLADLSGYADTAQINSYAADAFKWAVAAGIISGTDSTHLSPDGFATRAQCAAILQRFDTWVEDITTPDDTEPSAEQKEALSTALDYLDVMPFSYEGLIDQLEYEGYSHEAAVYAADNCGADWNEQAVINAKDYIDAMAFSYVGLIDQLEYEKFTTAQATYGADNCGADWYGEALECALGYLDTMAFSYAGLYDQLLYEEFTEDQAEHAVDNCGADWYEQAARCAAEYLESSDFTRDDLIEQLEYEGFTHEQAVYGVEQNGL